MRYYTSTRSSSCCFKAIYLICYQAKTKSGFVLEDNKKLQEEFLEFYGQK